MRTFFLVILSLGFLTACDISLENIELPDMISQDNEAGIPLREIIEVEANGPLVSEIESKTIFDLVPEAEEVESFTPNMSIYDPIQALWLMWKDDSPYMVVYEIVFDGWSSPIQALLFIYTDRMETARLQILYHDETPGIGSRFIESEELINQFNNQDALEIIENGIDQIAGVSAPVTQLRFTNAIQEVIVFHQELLGDLKNEIAYSSSQLSEAEEEETLEFYSIRFNYIHLDRVEEFVSVEGSSYELLPISRDGYAFDGWFIDSGFIQKIEKIININQDIELYPKWIPIEEDESFIEKNDIQSLFPNYDKVEDIALEHSIIQQVQVIFDRQNDILGKVYKVFAENDHGSIELLVGIDNNNIVVDYLELDFNQTPGLSVVARRDNFGLQIIGSPIQENYSMVDTMNGATISSLTVLEVFEAIAQFHYSVD